jgi:CubicO group peptidase (beta-lactamase class C family)
MISTVGDLQVWAKSLATGSLLSPARQQQRLQFVPTGIMFPPLPGTGISTGLPVQYGLGISSWGGLLGHNGQANAYTSDLLYLPAENATVIVLANGHNPSFTAAKDENVSDSAAVSMAQIVLPGALQTTAVSTVPTRPVH